MAEEKRPEWMSSISGLVNPDDYLLGRKIDTTFELSQKEKADRARETRVNLIANDKLKIKGDPILELERRRRELKLEIISNPVRLRQLREQILREEQAQKQSHDPSRSQQAASTKRDDDNKKRSGRSSSESSVSSSSPDVSRSHRHSSKHRHGAIVPKQRDLDRNRSSNSRRKHEHTNRHRDDKVDSKNEDRARREHSREDRGKDRSHQRDPSHRHHHHSGRRRSRTRSTSRDRGRR